MPPHDPLAASRISRFRVGLGAAVVILIAGAAVAVLVAALSSATGESTVVQASEPRESVSPLSPSVASGTVIFVHILGAVTHPGLYELRESDRAIDAIAAAGGYTPEADRRTLNLARFLSDGEQIYVPTVGEAAVPSTGSGPAGRVGGKVNLNTADATALETLPRVGPALAARILAWRAANGRFASIEDLMGVSGIGAKTFAGLKDLVTI